MPDDLSLSPDVLERGTVVTVGTFDGIHRGHVDVMRRVAARAAETGRTSLVVTFDPHPLEVINPAAAPLLLTPGIEKLEYVAELGIERVAVLPFTRALAAVAAPEFVLDILSRRLGMRELWIGHDHGLGRRREGDADTLAALGREHGFPVEVVHAVTAPDGGVVSSTAIRAAIAHGDLHRAELGLGRRYSLRARVVPGDRRGRELGYPTINMRLVSARKLLPPIGVYAVRVATPVGEFGGMMNLGPRPTFGDEALSLEAHLFDTDEHFYDASVRLEFVARLRDVVRFSGREALVAQLGKDAIDARRALTEV